MVNSIEDLKFGYNLEDEEEEELYSLLNDE